MEGLDLLRRRDRPTSVVCFGAHCDDIEIGCGGTLLALAARHDLEVTWVVFSASDAREAELRTSAAVFLAGAAAHRLVVLRFRDGFLPFAGAAVKDEFERLKKELRPDLVFTHTSGDLHQDHRLVCELTWNTFRDHLVLEYEIPKWDGDLGRPNTYVPLEAEIARRKAELLVRNYPSQAGKRWFTEDLFLSLLRLRGMECNAPSGFAEAFHARKLSLLP